MQIDTLRNMPQHNLYMTRIFVGVWVLISVQRVLNERKEVLQYPLKHEVRALYVTDNLRTNTKDPNLQCHIKKTPRTMSQLMQSSAEIGYPNLILIYCPLGLRRHDAQSLIVTD